MSKLRLFLMVSLCVALFYTKLNAQTVAEKETLSKKAVSEIIKPNANAEKGLKHITRRYAEEYIGVLAHDSLNGRKMGTKYGLKSAQYIANQFKIIGIKPVSGNSYLEEYLLKTKIGKRDSITKKIEYFDTTYNIYNVLGMIEGVNKNEYIIVGGHYDHLGARKNVEGDNIYNGADDNASGVAGVLQIARAFKESEKKPLRTIIFALWDAEEAGLIGSNRFVLACKYIENVKAYVNLDMIGRDDPKLGDNSVSFSFLVGQEDFGRQLKKDAKTYNLNINIKYKIQKNAPMNSDYAPFHEKQIPVIWYTSGLHSDYHKVSDEADKINWDKTVEITKAAFLSTWYMANEPVLLGGDGE